MSTEKIRVSWDEVHSSQVDDNLKHQSALAKAAEHGSMALAPVQTSATPAKSQGHWFLHTLVYMTIFGLLGGATGWGLGEFAWISPSNIDVLNEYIQQENKILDDEKKGLLTQIEADQAIKRLRGLYLANPYIAIVLGPWDQETKENKTKEQLQKDQLKEKLRSGIWYMVLGTMLAGFLAIAEPVVNRNLRAVVIYGSIGSLLGLVGGLVLTLFLDSLYWALGGGINDKLAPQIMARAVAWGLLGLFLALAPGLVLRNFKKCAIGLAGGLLGGMLGGALFDPVAMLFNNGGVSRFVGVTAIGGFAGLGIGLLENAVKTGWLKVSSGLLTGKQFVLYRNPTQIGSSPQNEIYLFKDPQIQPFHAQLHLVPGGVELQDLQTRTGTFVNGQIVQRCRLQAGDQIQIGNTTFVFHEKTKTS